MGALIKSDKFPKMQELKTLASDLVEAWEHKKHMLKYEDKSYVNIDKLEVEFFQDECADMGLSETETNYVLWCIGY